MPRKHRVWYPGATYHIFARGNKRAVIFTDDYDFRKYFRIYEEIYDSYPFLIHSYCLMSNHLHLQIETKDKHISQIMKEWHGKYAIYFNRRYQTDGHVFQGRYGAKIIENQDYFLEVSRYIHRNPMEAQIVSNPQDYSWSSYSAYTHSQNNPYITTSRTLSLFHNNSHIHYQKYVEKENSTEEEKVLVF